MARPKRQPAPAPLTSPRRGPGGAPERKSLVDSVAETVQQHGNPAIASVNVEVRYRAPHEFLGSQGFSLVSNVFLTDLLARMIAHKVITPRTAAVTMYIVGKQRMSILEQTQQEIADHLDVSRASVSQALQEITAYNWTRRKQRGVY